MQNGTYIGTTPAGVIWVCYEPATLESMKEAFVKICQMQTTKRRRSK